MDPYSETFLKHFGVKSTRVDARENRTRLTRARAKKRAELSRRIEHMRSEGTDFTYQEVLVDFQKESKDYTDTTLVAKKYKPKLDKALAVDLKFDDYDEGVEVLKEVRLDHVVHKGIPEIATGRFESTSFTSGHEYSRDNRQPVPNLTDESEDELYHYGVQGMKWGVRRGRAALGNAKGNLKRMSGNRDKRHKLVKGLRLNVGVKVGKIGVTLGSDGVKAKAKFGKKMVTKTLDKTLNKKLKKAGKIQKALGKSVTAAMVTYLVETGAIKDPNKKTKSKPEKRNFKNFEKRSNREFENFKKDAEDFRKKTGMNDF